MNQPTSAESQVRRVWWTGFSLIELLVVISIIGIAAVLAIPAFNNIADGFQMTQATDLVVGQLSRARHAAIAQNRNVEVRFYSFASGFGDKRYRAMQAFVANDDAAAPWLALGKAQGLPGNICLDSGNLLSPLIADQAAKSGTEAGVKIPRVGHAYQYVTLTFRPDGTAQGGDPDGTHLTLKSERVADPAPALPDNYAVVQIFPATGLLRSYRP